MYGCVGLKPGKKNRDKTAKVNIVKNVPWGVQLKSQRMVYKFLKDRSRNSTENDGKVCLKSQEKRWWSEYKIWQWDSGTAVSQGRWSSATIHKLVTLHVGHFNPPLWLFHQGLWPGVAIDIFNTMVCLATVFTGNPWAAPNRRDSKCKALWQVFFWVSWLHGQEWVTVSVHTCVCSQVHTWLEWLCACVGANILYTITVRVPYIYCPSY